MIQSWFYVAEGPKKPLYAFLFSLLGYVVNVLSPYCRSVGQVEKLEILIKLQVNQFFQGNADIFLPEDQGLKSKTKVPRTTGDDLPAEVL